LRILKPFATAILLVSVLLLASPTVNAQKRWDAPAIVTTNCSGCHAIDGNTQLRFFPRLAGLDAVYAQTKMAEFKETPSPSVIELYSWMRNAISNKKSTADPTRNGLIYMVGIAHTTKPGDTKLAIQWYEKQHPSPGRRGNKTLIHQGQELFTKGVPDQNILPCMTCHGDNAEGQATGPRLASQNAEYIQAQMENFRKGDRKHAPEMSMAARDLTPEQARAIAVFLQSK